jgi:predicted TIM-barrel fold metal-dependent hydrolase
MPQTAFTNAHVHLFTADHVPHIQLYYMMRDFLLRKRIVKLFIERIEKWEWWFPKALFYVIYALSWMFRGMGRKELEGFFRLITTVSRITYNDLLNTLGTDAPVTLYALLTYIKKRIATQNVDYIDYPVRICLKELAKDLFKHNDTNDDDLTQQKLLHTFVEDQGSDPRYNRIVALTMNFDRCFQDVYEPGFDAALREPKTPFKDQAHELLQLAASTGDLDLIPFLCVDPRASSGDLLDDVKHYIGQGFRGLKVYPPLGYLPEDVRLEPVFDHCLEHRIPVTTHCSPSGAGRKGAVNCSELAHPYNWVPVLNRLKAKYQDYVPVSLDANRFRTEIIGPAEAQFPEFPDAYEEHTSGDCYVLKEDVTDYDRASIAQFLHHIGYFRFKLCLGHFGQIEKKDVSAWWDEIAELIRHYAGCQFLEIYADISYSIPKGRRTAKRFFDRIETLLKDEDVKDRILFGSDWWMFMNDCTEAEYYWYVFEKWAGRKFYPSIGAAALRDAFERNADAFLTGAPTGL